MKKIHTEKAPAAIGPYSQAVISGNLVFTSGQIAINPATGNVDAVGIEAQTEQVMKNLGAVLEAAGSSYENSVKTASLPGGFSGYAPACLPDFAAVRNIASDYSY